MPNEALQRPGSTRSGAGLPRVITRRLGLGTGRNEDRVYTVAFVILVSVVGTACNLWPDEVPSALLSPLSSPPGSCSPAVVCS